MSHAKRVVASGARWLVVLTTSLLVLAGSVFARQPATPKNACGVGETTGCAISCGTHCSCCVSKTPQPNSPAPIAPASSTRTIAKDFQLVPLLGTGFASDRELMPAVRSHFLLPHFAPSAPIFVRHCTFLI
jgi:hypothetical protein